MTPTLKEIDMCIRTSQLAQIISTVWHHECSPTGAFDQLDEYAVDADAVSSILTDTWLHEISPVDAFDRLCNYCTIIDD